MNFSTPTLLNQQEIKILNIAVFIAIIFFLKKKSMVVSFLQGKRNTNTIMMNPNEHYEDQGIPVISSPLRKNFRNEVTQQLRFQSQ